MTTDTKPKYLAALFDLDGVLVDTENIYTSFWANEGSRYGKPATFAMDIKGTTLSDILSRHFHPSMHRDVEKAIHDFEDNMPYVLFPGVREFLNALRDLGIPMAIVTSSDDKKMNSLRKQQPELLEMMDAIIDGSMVTRSKPHPEGYLIAATRLKVQPNRCVVFEDSLQGLEAGRRSGAMVVGLPTTNPKEQVEPLCDVMIESFENLTPAELGF